MKVFFSIDVTLSFYYNAMQFFDISLGIWSKLVQQNEVEVNRRIVVIGLIEGTLLE